MRIEQSIIILSLLFILGCGKETPKPEISASSTDSGPFANNNGQIPDSSVYKGPLFKLSHDYPTVQPVSPSNPPWIQALQGQPISSKNAIAYVNALKQYVAPAMQQLVLDYAHWNAEKAGWYNEPWLGSIRESIHGMYLGSTFPASTFSQTGLTVEMSTYVLTYYDSVAAYTLGKIWGKTAMKPDLQTNAAQFPEGSIIVKVALTTASGSQWPVMAGAAAWPMYLSSTDSAGGAASLDSGYFMQFDIIVKDSKTAPKTGWVFSTLVYDKSVSGTPWDKMIPLGAMWGNDPTVNSSKDTSAPLYETVINPAAPPYSTETLGWGGRLSGPNDGAVVAPASIDGKIVPQIAASSCMSCHGTAEYELKSFLLPATEQPPVVIGDSALVLPTPGGTQWMAWFQDRPGTQPQDSGQVALDYDMVTAFKSIPAWSSAIQKKDLLKSIARPDAVRRGLRLKYNGR